MFSAKHRVSFEKALQKLLQPKAHLLPSPGMCYHHLGVTTEFSRNVNICSPPGKVLAGEEGKRGRMHKGNCISVIRVFSSGQTLG